MPCTRRDLLRWTPVSLAVAAFGPRLLQAQAPAGGPASPPPTSFTDVRRNVGFFTGQGGTIGTFVSRSAVAVVDTQFPATAKICLDGLKERAGERGIDLVVNTHHHGDHTSGNGVFRPAAKKIVAHARVPELMKAAARQSQSQNAPQPAPALPDSTFPDTFRQDLGDEIISAKHYGPAHTGGDIVVLFERANVVHMGDLVFNRRHPFIDRPAGASIAGWITLLESVMKDYGADTVFIFGHAGDGWKVTGTRADLQVQRDYFSALLDLVRAEMKAGKSREEFIRTTTPVPGFTDHGPLVERVRSAAWDELNPAPSAGA